MTKVLFCVPCSRKFHGLVIVGTGDCRVCVTAFLDPDAYARWMAQTVAQTEAKQDETNQDDAVARRLVESALGE